MQAHEPSRRNDRAPCYRQAADPPRVAAHVDLQAISRDLPDIKAEVAPQPTRWEILRLALGCLAAIVFAVLLIR